MTSSPIQLGLDTFGDVTADADGTPLPQHQVIRNIVDEGVLADTVGLDYFGAGEHHRADFAVSATPVVLAAIAARTKHIRIGSSVTVLSSDDPVRVYEQYATLDAVSHGRAEVTLGRGSFVEAFALFGFDLKDYDRLFEEKLDLYARLLAEEPVTWEGTTRPSLFSQEVFPHTASGHLPTWLAIGGSPASVVRAGQYGLPMKIAIIGGPLDRFRPYVELYHRTLEGVGNAPQPVGIHSPGFVADTDEAAREQFWPYYQEHFGRISRERGWNLHPTPDRFDAEIKAGALFVGSPETVAQKIAATARSLGVSRFDLKYATGALPHELLMHSIELYGKAVAPRVRELLTAASAR